ncbi:hypothetical protein D917_07293 [Trichinella nativa]|uniref:Uncharacterized protein n=1 Tax=Trichinella nativa TaxID=6335 RepID=A0A1Y3ESW1_9BILA|nr:hypothetical protein D917_07293 [Trichinella nativa]
MDAPFGRLFNLHHLNESNFDGAISSSYSLVSRKPDLLRQIDRATSEILLRQSSRHSSPPQITNLVGVKLQAMSTGTPAARLKMLRLSVDNELLLLSLDAFGKEANFPKIANYIQQQKQQHCC